jgi:hypothetical protein
MNWHDIGEIVKVLGAAVTTVAAWFAASIAYKGLEKWRDETSGKRRAELAEKVLANVYEMAEILRSARSPIAHKGSKLEEAPERRLLEHQEFFGRFRSMKHEFAAVFGADAAELFDILWGIRVEINNAVHSMLRTPGLKDSHDKKDKQSWEYWHDIAFQDPDERKDTTLKMINYQVSKAEAVCRPAIEIRAARQGRAETPPIRPQSD